MTSRAGLHGDIFYIESERVDDVQKLVYTAKAMKLQCNQAVEPGRNPALLECSAKDASQSR